MVFIEGTTFYTKFPIFLFLKYGYKPIDNAVILSMVGRNRDMKLQQQKDIEVKERIHWDGW